MNGTGSIGSRVGQDLGMIIQYFREVSHILDAGLHNRWHVAVWCCDVVREVCSTTLPSEDVNVFAYDYTGYGMSSGTCATPRLFFDAGKSVFRQAIGASSVCRHRGGSPPLLG